MKVKMYITIEVDDEEYNLPVDNDVGQELEKAVEEYLYDIEGITVKNIKTTTE